MKKKNKVYIAVGYIAIMVFTVLAIFTAGRSYTVYLNNPYGSEKTTVKYSSQGIIENTYIANKGGYTRFAFKGLKEGKATVTATIYNEANENEPSLTINN